MNKEEITQEEWQEIYIGYCRSIGVIPSESLMAAIRKEIEEVKRRHKADVECYEQRIKDEVEIATKEAYEKARGKYECKHECHFASPNCKECNFKPL